MRSRPLSPAESKAATRAAARVAAWGLVVYAGTRLAGAVLQSTSMAALVAQAVLAEWGLGRLGVTWSDPVAPVPTTQAILRRAARGAGVGLAAAAALAVVLAVTGGALLERASSSVSVLVVGLVSAGFLAMRDELLLHGLTLRVLVSVESPEPRIAACALASAAAALGEPGVAPRAVLVALLLGALYGALWIRDRGAWMAWGAHTAFLFVTGPLLHGGLFETRVASSPWGGADAGVLGGWAAVAVLAAAAAVATAWARRAPARAD